ncbi:ATP-binding cassette sub-family C member 9-like [Diadema setosum]|uniref:ATP-binding cassette sub-family C member 9-like n=1 Tax=Diadema setosum TaxID=31175 RepID=UPI003B3B072F
MNETVRSRLNATGHVEESREMCLVVTILHGVFVVAALVILLLVGLWRRLKSSLCFRHHVRFQGHSARWVAFMAIVVVGLMLIAEGSMTDSTCRVKNLSPKFHLVFTGVFTTLGILVAMAFYHYAELWRYRRMLTLMSFYWGTQLLASITCLPGKCKPDKYSTRFKQSFRDPSEDRMFYRESDCSLISQLTFWWLNFLFVAGFKRPITLEKLGSIPEAHSAEYLYAQFKRRYDVETERARRRSTPKNLNRVIARTHWRGLGAAGILKLIADMLGYVGPMAIGGITLYVTRTDREDPKQGEQVSIDIHTICFDVSGVRVSEFFANGYVLIGVVFVSSIVQHVCNQTYQYWVSVEGMHAKSALQSMVYEKALRLSTQAMSGGAMSVGQVTNLMSADASNVMFYFFNVNEIWAIPIKIGVALILLYGQLGHAAIIAASLFVVVIPLQTIVATILAKVTKSVLESSDARLRRSNEMLEGIRHLKLYGWEFLYYETIKAARNRELRYLLKLYILFAITFSINSGTPIVVTLIAFALYTPLTGTPLTPDKAFSSLALFNQVTAPLFLLPYLINLSVNFCTSTKRLARFLSAPEVETGIASQPSRVTSTTSAGSDGGGVRGHRSKGCTPKSSFGLEGLSHLDTVVESDCEVEGPDEVFLENHENTMVKEVLFRKRERQRIGAYCTASFVNHSNGMPETQADLPHNIAIAIKNGSFVWDPESEQSDIRNINVEFPKGKLTLICGPVGSGKSCLVEAILREMTTVSGSVQFNKDIKRVAYAPQKPWLVNTSLRKNVLFGETMQNSRYQRIIRACSLGADIDMLPARDRTELGDKGITLSGGQKQRVSVARAMYARSDVVILDDPLSALDMHVSADLFNKGIKGILRQRHQTVILVTHQLQYLPHADKIIYMSDGEVKCQGTSEEIVQVCPELKRQWQQAVRKASESGGDKRESTTELERKKLFRQCSRQISIFSNAESVRGNEIDSLLVQEERDVGAVAFSNYIFYLSSVGYVIAAVILAFAVLRGSLQVATNFWLSEWSEAGMKNTTTNNNTTIGDQTDYVIGFAALSMATVVCQVLFNFMVNAGILTAAKRIHFYLLENLIRVPMRFFDITPIGRILNRLTFDTRLIDQRLLITINMLANAILTTASTIVVNAVVNPYFLIFLLPVTVLFTGLLIFYIRTARELQRTESVSRSPIFAHFSETLGGLTTIRAFSAGGRFFKTISDLIDTNNTCSIYLLAAERWLGIRLDLLGAVIVLMAGLSSLLGAAYLGMESSLIGLAISYALMVSSALNLLVRSISELELYMNSVERIRYYAIVPRENYEGEEPPADWPSKGEIHIEDASFRYASELDPVLKQVDIQIHGRQKIGVCGRSGSGKSSLTLALFRLVETCQGQITIDGIDINTVPLKTLRQRLSIIPQDAVLFAGTIRSNLDPAGELCDTDLWCALEISKMKETVKSLEHGLDTCVAEGGENFSVGQRQLFCLARAFLRKSSVLVMDEATASIDVETDSDLQKIVADVFKDRTVLTIAHRINTIINSDKIITLAKGTVEEYGAPKELLRNRSGLFSSLVRAGRT